MEQLLSQPPAVLRYEVVALERIVVNHYATDDAKMRQFLNALHVGERGRFNVGSRRNGRHAGGDPTLCGVPRLSECHRIGGNVRFSEQVLGILSSPFPHGTVLSLL